MVKYNGYRRRNAGFAYNAAVAGMGVAKQAYKRYKAKQPSASAPKWRRKLPTRTVTKEKREGRETGALQWTLLKKKSGYKPRTAVINSRLLRAAQESLVYGWRNVKNFDDYGAIPSFSQNVGTTVQRQPCFAFLLNGINRATNLCLPARQLYYSQTSKNYLWTATNGLTADGALSTGLIEQYDAKDFAQATSPGARLYHDYTHVKMNCWGAKNKSVRWIVQVIQPLTDEVNPWHWNVDVPMGTVAGQAIEGQLKQLTYNPISRITHRNAKDFKVLKSVSFVISPSSTTDGDADPQVKTIDWFMRFNRVTNYDKATQNNATEFIIDDMADFKNNTQEELRYARQYSCIPRDLQNIILLVRCSDYSPATETFSNTIHGSFDLDFKTKFITVD